MKFIYTCILIYLFTPLWGQGTMEATKDIYGSPTVHATWTEEKIKLDGELNEGIWMQAEMVTDFVQSFPYDTSLAETKTEVMVTYDDKNVYIAAICHDKLEGNYVVQSLKRDFSYPKSDAFAVYFDPLNDETNGFNFTVNPLGAQREGLVANGGSFGVTTIWDNRWLSAVKQYEDKWIVEMAIPFKTLRYNSETPTWKINFSRHDLKRNENSSWARVPRGLNVACLACTGTLVWDKPPKKQGANISLIPYAIAKVNKDYENGRDPELKVNGGLDAKIAVTSSLNLDVTINPDFSQVEVDRQVINLDRFSIFFPEQRTFFIENSDLFANFGFSNIRPFFSRRIGLFQGKEVPIIGGLRLSGKINQNWRIGVMSMQTEGLPADKEIGRPSLRSQNYSVFALQRRVFTRSNIGVIAVNRQAFTGLEWKKNDYNTIAGIDLNISNKDNRLQGKLFYHHSFSPNQKKDAGANASWLQYTHERFFIMWNHEYIGTNYNAEVGFVPRVGQIRFEPKFDWFFYPKKGRINRHGPNLYFNMYTDTEFDVIDRLVKFDYDINFQNQALFVFFARELYTRLTFPFDPSGTGGEPLPADTDYFYRNAGARFTSNFRKKFSYEISSTYGSYYNGTRLTLEGELTYRFQPWGSISIAAEQNEIRLPDPYSDASLTLISPRLEVSFTKSLFFSTFLQYNNQVDNLNINTRFQWRFAPMSDLFIVYTDNYNPTDPFAVKNRALVIKLNYWFTL